VKNSVAPLPSRARSRKCCSAVAAAQQQIGSNPIFAFCRSPTANQRSGHFVTLTTDTKRRFQQFRSRAQRQR